MTMREKLVVAAATAIVEKRVPSHVVELLVQGDPQRGITPKVLHAAVDAILNVLRDPDEAMIEAGLETNSRFGKPAMRNIWQHMIDTIINEGRG